MLFKILKFSFFLILIHLNDTSIAQNTNEYSKSLNNNHVSLGSHLIPAQDPDGMLWGAKDLKSNELIIPYSFEMISPFRDKYAIIYHNEKMGLVDEIGKIIVEPFYDHVASEMKCGFIAFEHDYGPVLLFDSTGKALFPMESGFNFLLCEKRATLGKGMINFSGDTILPFHFVDIQLLSEGFCIAAKVADNGYDRLYGLYDLDGKQILPHQYSFIDHFYCGRAIVRKNGKYGIINEYGKELFYTDYDRIDRYFNDYAIVYQNNNENDIRVGIIDRNGKEVIPVQYQWLDYVYNFSEGLAAMALNRKYGFLDTTGKMIVPFQYDRVESFRNGIAKVWRGWRYVGYINTKGEEVIPTHFEAFDQANLRRYFNQYIIGIKDSTQFVYNYSGDLITKINFEQIYEFNESQKTFWVLKNYKCGLLDSNFQTLLPIEFESLEPFFPNTILARKYDKSGILDLNGKIIVDFLFDWIEPFYDNQFSSFENGLAIVKNDNKMGVLNNSFKMVIPIIYDEIEPYSYGLCRVKRNEKYGFVNDHGVEVIPVIYDSATSYDGYQIEVSLNGETLYIDSNGEPIVEE